MPSWPVWPVFCVAVGLADGSAEPWAGAEADCVGAVSADDSALPVGEALGVVIDCEVDGWAVGDAEGLADGLADPEGVPPGVGALVARSCGACVAATASTWRKRSSAVVATSLMASF